MSNSFAWPLTCKREQTVTLKANNFCTRQVSTRLSPIDELFRQFRNILPLGTPDALSNNDVLGRILLLGIVSGAETYFRTILASLLNLCPISRSHAAPQTLPFGALDYYDKDEIGLGLLEGISFATEGELLKATRKITRIEWDPQKSSVGVAISQFESLAQFRHAAVHASGRIGQRNMSAIGLSLASQSLVVRFSELQHAAEVTVNAVRAYNQFMFQKIIERWVIQGQLTGDSAQDFALTKSLVRLFCSRQEGLGRRGYTAHVCNVVIPKAKAAMRPKPATAPP